MACSNSVRYRLYSAWGLTTQQITQVVAFYSLTLWLGLAAIGARYAVIAETILRELQGLRPH